MKESLEKRANLLVSPGGIAEIYETSTTQVRVSSVSSDVSHPAISPSTLQWQGQLRVCRGIVGAMWNPRAFRKL